MTLAFRSFLVPLKAAVMNLLSIGAAYGVVVMVFQYGWFSALVGLTAVPIVSFLPLLMFAGLFGLSMDYEVFLMSHVQEHYQRGPHAARRDRRGLAESARVITAAALIMVAVFASFILIGDPTIKQFGVGLSVAVIIDATLVRCLLVPAAMALMGRAAWWIPPWLDKRLPQISVEGTATSPSWTPLRRLSRCARDPRPGAVRHSHESIFDQQDGSTSRPSNASSVASRTAASAPARRRRAGRRRSRAGRRASRRGRPRRRPRAPSRPLRSARVIPPQRLSLRQTIGVAPLASAPGATAVSSIATGTSASAATARSASTPWTGSSTSSMPLGASARRWRAPPRPPGAVRVDPQRDLRADRRAHRRHPAAVVADPDLQLHAAEAGLRRLTPPPRRRRRGPPPRPAR